MQEDDFEGKALYWYDTCEKHQRRARSADQSAVGEVSREEPSILLTHNSVIEFN